MPDDVRGQSPIELQMRAAVRPTSVNADGRSVEVLWTVGARVLRHDWDGPYYEELSLDPKHVRMGRLNNGAPFLNAHNSRDLEAVIGVVEKASLTAEGGVATVRFAKAEDDEDADRIYRKVQDGIIQNVSVGYRVYQYDKVEGGDEAIPVYRAVDWEPFEISAVAVGADDDAGFRGKEANAKAAPLEPVRKLISTIKAPAELKLRMMDEGCVMAERGAPMKEIRERFLDILANEDSKIMTDQSNYAGNERTLENPEFRRSAMADALTLRAVPGYTPTNDAWREFGGMNFEEVARQCLEAAGVNTRGLRGVAVFKAAFGQPGFLGRQHGTSDFPLILMDAQNKVLAAAYEAAPGDILKIARKSTSRDFRTKYLFKYGEFPPLEENKEHEEIKHVTIGEARESYGIVQYADQFSITKRALVNDDLDAFSRNARNFGTAAREKQIDAFVDMLKANAGLGPTMSDGKSLIHADHGNKPAGAALAAAALGEMRRMMRMQKGINGQPISVGPKYLVVPAALETLGEVLLANIAPAKTDDVNPFAGKLSLVVEPRLDALSAVAFYVAAAAEFGTFEYATLEGEENPQIETKDGWDVLGMSMRCTMTFGCGAGDWRGIVRQQGA